MFIIEHPKPPIINPFSTDIKVNRVQEKVPPDHSYACQVLSFNEIKT